MRLFELITSRAEHGKLSTTKFWSNVGSLAMTIVFLNYGFKGTLPEWYMWVYASAVVAPQLLSKLITLRWGIPSDEDKPSRPQDQ